MKKGFFIVQGRKRINPVFIAAIALALAGCSHASESQESRFSMAPPPPVFDPNAAAEIAPSPLLMAFTGQAIPFPSHIKLSDSGKAMPDVLSPAERRALTSSSSSDRKCKIKDRFDRSALLAYQWGQNRIGLRVKGISLDSQEINMLKLEYKLRLQPEVPRKERCRYESGWQGLVGSGYNELFLREDNTVFDQLDKITDDAEDAVDKLFR